MLGVLYGFIPINQYLPYGMETFIASMEDVYSPPMVDIYSPSERGSSDAKS
jgi:hypothetical protein